MCLHVTDSFLKKCSVQDENVMHITFEDLANEPISNMNEIFDILGLSTNSIMYENIGELTQRFETGLSDVKKIVKIF